MPKSFHTPTIYSSKMLAAERGFLAATLSFSAGLGDGVHHECCEMMRLPQGEVQLGHVATSLS